MRKFIKNRIFKLLNNIKLGELIIQENGVDYVFGKKDTRYPSVSVIIHDAVIYRVVLLEGANGASTGYLQGHWECDNLTDLFYLFFINLRLYEKIDTGIAKLTTKLKTLFYIFKINNIARSRKNIYKHYDLGNIFFEQFLDKYMMYSCAIFDKHHTVLDSASENKLRIICDKLKLTENDHLLEIGTGWGGLAIYAASHYGCHVTTTTISKEQYVYAEKLIEKNNLTNKITLLNLDYRLIKGKFDKIVSIEMIEAVGFQYFPTYFKIINSLLNPQGEFLLQAIIINDKDYHRAKYEIDFIKKYIFPGGCLPSMAEIRRCLMHYTQMECVDVHDITKHYVTTLKQWENSFNENLSTIRSLGFDDFFIRMWRYYFSYCQAGFEHQHIQDVQLLIKKASLGKVND